MTQSSPSEGLPQGLRVQVRLLVSHPPARRFTADGDELLQVRGTVVDEAHHHPEVVVRFGGQRQTELYRWAAPGRHLSVDGQLEVKHWLAEGRPRVTLLIDALNIYPLNDLEPDLRRVGIYATPASTSTNPADRVTRTPLGKDARANQMRSLLVDA